MEESVQNSIAITNTDHSRCYLTLFNHELISRATRRMRNRYAASRTHASEPATVQSKSFASRRQRPV